MAVALMRSGCGRRDYRRPSREGLGSNVIFDALALDDIDVYVDLFGTLGQPVSPAPISSR